MNVLGIALASPEIRQFMREKREMAGLTQEAVGLRLGFISGHQSISNWERGAAAIPLDKLAEVVRLYHIDADELIRKIQIETRDVLVELLIRNKAG